MHVLAHKEPPEQLLDGDGLLGKVRLILPVVVLHPHQLELLARVEHPEGRLDPDTRCLLLQEFFPLDVHPELRLDFERRFVISPPVLLCLVGRIVVQFP